MHTINENTFTLKLLESLLDCNRTASNDVMDEAAELLGTEKVLTTIISSALNSLGERWAKGELALTQIYAASRIVEEAIDRYSLDVQSSRIFTCKVLVGSLDYHGLGKNIVIKFLKANGVQVVDAGINVSPERVVHEAIENKVNAILLSALMYNGCAQTEEIKRSLESQEIKIPIMVGGAPFNFDKNLWKKVGADAVGQNICSVSKELKEMLR